MCPPPAQLHAIKPGSNRFEDQCKPSRSEIAARKWEKCPAILGSHCYVGGTQWKNSGHIHSP